MSTTPFIGEIQILPYTFAPLFFVTCEGQLLPISQNPTLYAVIGDFYGGNGRTSMGIPNLKQRAPLGMGQGPGLSPYTIGNYGGANTIALDQNQIPSHDHTWEGAMGLPDLTDGNIPKSDRMPVNFNTPNPGGGTTVAMAYTWTGTIDTPLSDEAVSITGQSHDHENRQPYLALRFCMAIEGIFPSRN